MAICVDEENAFYFTKLGNLTPDTEPFSKCIYLLIFAYFCCLFCNLTKEAFNLVVVAGKGGGDWGDCCGGAAE